VYRFSLKSLFLAASSLAILFAFVFTPRLQISKNTIEAIPIGLSLDEACNRIGGQPGWYDGVDFVVDWPPHLNGIDGNWVVWATPDGVISAVDNDGIQGICFFSPSQLSIYSSNSGRIYDRTIMKLYASTSMVATIVILGFTFLLWATPFLGIAWFRGYSVREFLLFGIILSTTVFLLFCLLTGRWWSHHDTSEFWNLSALTTGTAVVGIIILLCWRIVFGNKPVSDQGAVEKP